MSYRPPERQKQWIELRGGRLCVWEMTFEELGRLNQYAMRPAIDPRGGVDQIEAAIWRIALSCYESDTEDARRIWPDERVAEIRRLPGSEINRLTEVLDALNGTGAAEEERLRDFTSAPEPNGSPLRSGASSISTGSPVS